MSSPQPMSMLERILRLMAERKASDVYLSAHAPAYVKINGQCIAMNSQVLPPEAPLNLLAEMVPPTRIEELKETGELNMALPVEGVGNFRVSAMRQRGTYAVVVRYISSDIPALATLNVPPVLGDLVMEKRGLILMVGATGAGKSTTLASMLDLRNANATGHILTIEDPVEFIFRNKKSVVNQREVGSDTASLAVGLKNALRQAPDVIMIGEIRDRETMSAALAYAQSGHLCLSTLHANNSYQALNRILSFYPPEVRPAMLGDLASSLKAIVSQRLLRTVNNTRMPAVEILLNSRLTAELIEQGIKGFFFLGQRAAHAAGAGVVLLSLIAAVGVGDDLGGPAAELFARCPVAQPFPHMAHAPVQQRGQCGNAAAHALGRGENLLIPALAALGPVLAAAHFDATVADGALALAHAGDDQRRAVGEQLGDLGGHRINLDLPGAPPQGVVVRRRYAPAQDVHEKALVERRPHHAVLDAALLELVHDLLGCKCQRGKFLPGVGVQHREAPGAGEQTRSDEVQHHGEGGRAVLSAAPGDDPVVVLGAVGAQALQGEIDGLGHLQAGACFEEREIAGGHDPFLSRRALMDWRTFLGGWPMWWPPQKRQP